MQSRLISSTRRKKTNALESLSQSLGLFLIGAKVKVSVQPTVDEVGLDCLLSSIAYDAMAV